MKSRFRGSKGGSTSAMSPTTTPSSSRRHSRSSVPRLTPSSSESSTSSASQKNYSPDNASIFKGAKILRSQLFSSPSSKGDLYSVAESSPRSMMQHSMDHSFSDDWSDPWSVQEGHMKTPSPVHSSKYSPRKTTGRHTPGSGGSNKRISVSPVDFPTIADDEWEADFDSVQQESSLLSGQDASLSSGPDSSTTGTPPPPPVRRNGSVSSIDSSVPPPPPRRVPSAEEASEFGSNLTPTSGGTHTSAMGRESSLRFKTVTYIVEPNLDELSQNDESGFYNGHHDDGPFDEYDEFDDDEDDDLNAGYVPSKYQQQQEKNPANYNRRQQQQWHDRSPSSNSLDDFGLLLRDPAYQHAQHAGVLWQTLVGQHVRFPKTWWDGARSPSMGLEDCGGKYWRYIARHRVYNNSRFMKVVRHRSSPGRLLLHIVIRDLMSSIPLQDVAIGCLHPNARGIRKTQNYLREDEACREIWMAVRKRPAGRKQEAVSLIEPILTRGRHLEEIANDSPLGSKRKVTNVNMRAVFGDKPPLQTVFIDESELYERMMAAEEKDSFAAPALVLLQEFL